MNDTGPDPARPGGQPDPADLSDAFSRLARPAATLLETYARVMSQVADGLSGSRGGSATAQPVSLPAALLEAGAIASGSSMRYAQRLTEIVARNEALLMSAAALRAAAEEPSPERTRAEAEDFRRFLREIGEAALFEARKLEQDLERLGEAVAQGVAPATPDGDYHRRWAAKP
jgi:hypothetical protein